MTTKTMKADSVMDRLRRRMLVDGFHLVLDIDRSQGSRMVDARDGKSYLDFYSFFASSPLGMNHPALLEPEFLDRLGRTAVNKVCNSDIYTQIMAEFVDTLDRVGRPDPMRWFFFIEGGAPAVENALKVAFDWKVRRNFAGGAKAELGSQILHLERAFHGRSGYTLSLTNTDPNKTLYFPKFDWPRIPSPAIRFPLDDAENRRLDQEEGQTLELARRLLEQRQGDVAAIIAEPIQCEGGDRHFRPSFLAGLRRLADEFEALLIFDEVQTGVGVTGKFWAWQHHDITPDIIVFAKKMQVGGIMVGPRVDEEPENVFHVPSRINSTWGAHIVDMLRATRILEVIERDNLVDSAARMGQRLLNGLEELQRAKPSSIENARGQGLICAIDLPDTKTRDEKLRACVDGGLMALACGERSLRFRPSLTVSADEVDEALGHLDRAL